MVSRNRRDFIKLCAASVPALVVANGISAERTTTNAHAQSAYRTPSTLDRYIDPLPILKPLIPHRKRNGKVQYRVRMVEFKHQMHSQLPPTRAWGYEGQYPGPIFDVMSGVPVEVTWENGLPTQHIFQVDPHIHGAMPPSPEVRTVPHLHGSRTTSESDGLPEKWFECGKSVRYHYPNDQQAATLWYHDHALGITRLNVYAGLSGFYLLRDAHELGMNLPSGDYEIPLVLQDRLLDDKGQLTYMAFWDEGAPVPTGVWGPGFFGDLAVVNGAVYPHLDVEPCRYRFRVLNGSNSRYYNLYLNLAQQPTDIPSLVRFHQIGSDGGFLSKPVELERLLLGPAERADLIVDFSGHEGKTITLSNNASAPFPGWDLIDPIHPALYELMKFRVSLPASSKGKSFSMPSERPLPRMEPTATTVNRDFVLSEDVDKQGKSLGLKINGQGYDDPITESPKLGSIETWRFINTTDDAHPMHLHLVQFQVLHRQGFNLRDYVFKKKLVLVGAPRPPAENEAGWKDTAVVYPNELLTIIVRFEGYTGRYVYHCHMLEHEDNDMMRPYQVVLDKS
jgi:spore coat protein A, manganese oxidase